MWKYSRYLAGIIFYYKGFPHKRQFIDISESKMYMRDGLVVYDPKLTLYDI